METLSCLTPLAVFNLYLNRTKHSCSSCYQDYFFKFRHSTVYGDVSFMINIYFALIFPKVYNVKLIMLQKAVSLDF